MLLSMWLSFLLTTFVTVSWITPAQAVIDGTPTWIGPKYDKDDFLGIATTLIAFTTGTDATLRVTVKNTLSPAKPLNISAVKVLLDWGINYSSTEASQSSPHVIPKYNSTLGIYYYYTFTIVFKVPATTVASNLFRHYWWVFVEEVNATTGPQAVTLHDSYSGSQDFTVYSADQATAQSTRIEYERLVVTTTTYVYQEAKILLKNAGVHKQMADDCYKNGDFAGAKTQYLTALDMLNDAITSEETYQTTIQDNEVKYREAQIKGLEASANQSEAAAKREEAAAKREEAYAKYYEAYGSYYNKTGDAAVKQADAAMIEANATMRMADAQWSMAQAANLQSTALNLFGFGFILFGVAAIIWAFKRPKPT